jgi:hypothetical protein
MMHEFGFSASSWPMSCARIPPNGISEAYISRQGSIVYIPRLAMNNVDGQLLPPTLPDDAELRNLLLEFPATCTS